MLILEGPCHMSCFMSNLLNTNFMKCYIRSNRSMIRWKNRASVCSTNWVTCDQAGVPCANGNGKHTVTPASTRCRHMNININIYIYMYMIILWIVIILYIYAVHVVCVCDICANIHTQASNTSPVVLGIPTSLRFNCLVFGSRFLCFLVAI